MFDRQRGGAAARGPEAEPPRSKDEALVDLLRRPLLTGSTSKLSMKIARTLTLGMALVLAGCAGQPREPQISLPAPYVQQGVTVVVNGLWRDASGNVSGVSGIATNTSGRDLMLCQVSFDALDAQGVKVSSAVAATNGLKVDQKWRFQAVFTTPFSVVFTSVAPGQVTAVPSRATNISTYDAAKKASDQCEALGIHNGYPLTPESKRFMECLREHGYP
jgi:hypothetical protein